MKNVQLVQRTSESDTAIMNCGKVLEMVTIEPAKALGIDHLTGSLEKGKKADVIMVNVHQPHLAPFGVMPVQRLVYHAEKAFETMMSRYGKRDMLENPHLYDAVVD